MKDNLELKLYKIFENYLETFSTYEYDVRCIPEEVIGDLILDIVEFVKAKS